MSNLKFTRFPVFYLLIIYLLTNLLTYFLCVFSHKIVYSQSFPVVGKKQCFWHDLQ